ncbi:MAG: mechanosensitive ion channel family protein [Eubacterium sp.]|nr:mechanosensitive ion channel family protein [Eubacterium sp.]
MEKYFKMLSDSTSLPAGLFRLLFVLLVGYIVIRIVMRAVRRMLEKSAFDESSYVVIMRTVRIILWILLGLTLISTAGVNTTPFVAVLASIGGALALAMKDSLSNVAGGVIILVSKPFVKGDEIEIEDVSGIVDYIDLMDTRLHTFSNQMIKVPNSKVVNSILINRTRNDIVRVDCKFSVSYDSDLAKVKELLNNIVKDGDVLLEDPKPVIGVSSYEESGVVWDMYVWARTEERFKAKYYLGETVKSVFDANGIRIPFPHVDVTIEGENDK